MESLTVYFSEELFISLLQIYLTYGVGGAFAITSIIIIISTIVFKAFSFLSIKF